MRMTSTLCPFEDGVYYDSKMLPLFSVEDFNEKNICNFVAKHKDDDVLLGLFLNSLVEHNARHWNILRREKKAGNDSKRLKNVLEKDPVFQETIIKYRNTLIPEGVPFWKNPIKSVDEAYNILIFQRHRKFLNLTGEEEIIFSKKPMHWREQLQRLEDDRFDGQFIYTAAHSIMLFAFSALTEDYHLSCGFEGYFLAKMAAPNIETPILYDPITPLLEEHPVKVKMIDGKINITFSQKASGLILDVAVKSLKPLLHNDELYGYGYREATDNLRNRIAIEKRVGMTYRKLAEKYYPDVIKRKGLESAMDLVKSTVAYSNKKIQKDS